jgi:hypothetical protein
MRFTSQRRACHTWTGVHAARTQSATKVCVPRQQVAAGCISRERVPSSCRSCSQQLQHQPVGSLASTAANELLFVLSRSLPARSLCAITLYPSATSHPHPFVAADRLRAWKQTSHQANSNISCRVKGGLFAFDFGAVPRIEERNFRRPPVGHNSRELNRTSLLRQPVITFQGCYVNFDIDCPRASALPCDSCPPSIVWYHGFR